MLVSIIIPCYNVEAYITQSLNSALQQSYKNIEIICVDNNSTDSTLEILKAFEIRYPDKIRVIRELNKGASIARNTGFSESKGSWIQFLDADDLLLKNKIEHQISFLGSVQDVAFIAGAYKKRKLNGYEEEFLPDLDDPFKALFISKLGITSANLFSREMIYLVEGWDPTLHSSQEADLMFRILKINSNVIFDKSFNTIIRERSAGQISQLNPKRNWIQFLKLRLSILSYLKEEHAQYFLKENDFYYQNLFTLLRILFKFDRQIALNVFKQEFDSSFIPNSSSKRKLYSFLFKWFGFARTEWIWSVLLKK